MSEELKSEEAAIADQWTRALLIAKKAWSDAGEKHESYRADDQTSKIAFALMAGQIVKDLKD